MRLFNYSIWMLPLLTQIQIQIQIPTYTYYTQNEHREKEEKKPFKYAKENFIK